MKATAEKVILQDENQLRLRDMYSALDSFPEAITSHRDMIFTDDDKTRRVPATVDAGFVLMLLERLASVSSDVSPRTMLESVHRKASMHTSATDDWACSDMLNEIALDIQLSRILPAFKK